MQPLRPHCIGSPSRSSHEIACPTIPLALITTQPCKHMTEFMTSRGSDSLYYVEIPEVLPFPLPSRYTKGGSDV